MKILTNYTTPTYKNYPVFGVRKMDNTIFTPDVDEDLLLTTGCDNIIGNLKIEKMSETKKFGLLKNKFGDKIAPINLELGIDDWNFYTNSTPENMRKLQESEEKYDNIFRDKDTYNTFLRIDKRKLSKHDAKILKGILKSFENTINLGDDIKALDNKENEISQKFNNHVMKIDGREVSNAEITNILQTETNPEVRKKAYDAKVKRGDLIAEDLRELVKMRNNYAKKQGYDNFFDYKLKETYDVEPEFLDKLLDQVHKKALPKIIKFQKEKTEKYRNFYKTDHLEAYHYGLLLDSDPDKTINKILKNLSKENPHIVEEISKRAYEGMGYDIDEMLNSGKLTFDLYPRKNKNSHGFCFGIDYGKDTRILANLNNDVKSIDTLCHEMGHSVYNLGVPENLQFFDKSEASMAMTEAIALMMGDLVKTENILTDYVPAKTMKNFKKTFIKDEANFIARMAFYIEFERDMYKNPDKDPAEIWNEKKIKYQNRDEQINNEWATIPHFLSHPTYCQNYFRATLMKAQIYNHLKENFGNITENKKVADYLNNEFFSYGATIEEYDLIKQLTGKDFSADDFVKSL